MRIKKDGPGRPSLGDKRLKRFALFLTDKLASDVQAALKPGETVGDFYRDAIAHRITLRQKEVSNAPQ
jgi:hypothetical protein